MNDAARILCYKGCWLVTVGWSGNGLKMRNWVTTLPAQPKEALVTVQRDSDSLIYNS
jgi:hypothetical protein